jgi:t-SNARE complex subunit (syntaxin)
MEAKSNNIKETAFTMKNQAKQLEREARKRNCRLWAILICIVIALLIEIIVPIATTR